MIAVNFVSGLIPMQLNANKTAQFFIANEYYQVQLEKEWLVLTSLSSEERIPFHVWNGEVQIRRGVFFGTLQFCSSRRGRAAQLAGTRSSLAGVSPFCAPISGALSSVAQSPM